MAIPITIPRLGWTMEEGVFVGWLKADGDKVRAGEVLFTLESEKATEDIECLDSGVLRIPADAPREGDKVAVGTVIAHLIQPADQNQKEPGRAGLPAEPEDVCRLGRSLARQPACSPAPSRTPSRVAKTTNECRRRRRSHHAPDAPPCRAASTGPRCKAADAPAASASAMCWRRRSWQERRRRPRRAQSEHDATHDCGARCDGEPSIHKSTRR